MAFLQIKGLYKKFGDLEVLRGVDVQLEKGETLAIIGSSGSGKTTLLRCTALLERAGGGEIVLDGERVVGDAVRPKNKGGEIGMVFQSFNLFPHRNVKNNLTLAARLQYNKNAPDSFLKRLTATARARKKAAYADIDSRADALLERVGLADKARAYPCELSGGQQQRVAIARALMLQPKLLCFDEPTSALDPELTREVLNVIRDLKTDGYTMMIVTHELDFARSVADNIVFMSDGKVEEQGAPEKLFVSPESDKTREFLDAYAGFSGSRRRTENSE